MAVKITTYKWFYEPKSGLGEYTVSWKDPYGTVVCSMDVKVVGEHSEVMNSLSLAADSLRKMYPTKFVSLDELLSMCDIVSVHVPLTKKTKDLINAENITKMKSTALLINTARGPVVNAKALAEALKNGIIAGAGVDVFDNEPPIVADNPLLSAPNVVLTPHIGFATAEAMQKRAVIAFDNIKKYLAGKPQNVM